MVLNIPPQIPTRQDNKDIVVVPIERSDIPLLSGIFFAAFIDAFIQRLFPHTPKVQEWWDEANMDGFLHDSTVHFIKAIDYEGTILGYAKWVVPAEDGKDKIEERWPEWPEDSDKEMCDLFFGHLASQRQSLMGNRTHYCKINSSMLTWFIV
jgi:hypothetical protein